MCHGIGDMALSFRSLYSTAVLHYTMAVYKKVLARSSYM